MLSLIQSSSLIYAGTLYAILWGFQTLRENNRLQYAVIRYQVRRASHSTSLSRTRWS